MGGRRDVSDPGFSLFFFLFAHAETLFLPVGSLSVPILVRIAVQDPQPTSSSEPPCLFFFFNSLGGLPRLSADVLVSRLFDFFSSPIPPTPAGLNHPRHRDLIGRPSKLVLTANSNPPCPRFRGSVFFCPPPLDYLSQIRPGTGLRNQVCSPLCTSWFEHAGVRTVTGFFFVTHRAALTHDLLTFTMRFLGDLGGEDAVIIFYITRVTPPLGD